MKMFGTLTTDGLEDAGDFLGGGGLIETGVYTGTVKLAYVRPAQNSNAQSVTVHIQLGTTEFRETFWVTNRNGENSYQDKKDARKRHQIPGFQMVNDLCLLTTGYELAPQDIEEKVVKLWDFEAQKEVPQNVPVLVDLLDKEITVAVIRQVVDKKKKNDAGIYVNTGETREENIADKFFHSASRRTVTEVKEGLEEGVFLNRWEEKNAGKTRNRAKGGEGNTGAPGAPGAAARPGAAPAVTRKPKTSLFGT